MEPAKRWGERRLWGRLNSLFIRCSPMTSEPFDSAEPPSPRWGGSVDLAGPA